MNHSESTFRVLVFDWHNWNCVDLFDNIQWILGRSKYNRNSLEFWLIGEGLTVATKFLLPPLQIRCLPFMHTYGCIYTCNMSTYICMWTNGRHLIWNRVGSNHIVINIHLRLDAYSFQTVNALFLILPHSCNFFTSVIYRVIEKGTISLPYCTSMLYFFW